MRAVAVIASAVIAAGTRASGIWTVSGTTLRSSDTSSMTGAAPLTPKCRSASAPRNSVWPGCAKPADMSTLFAMGLVTSARAAPRLTASTAASMAAMTAGALAESGVPATTGAAQATDQTGSRVSNSAGAGARSDTASMPTSRPSAAARAARTPGSPSTANGASACSRRASHAMSVMSGPIPAGSPMVTASGAEGGSEDGPRAPISGSRWPRPAAGPSGAFARER
jgi:hypothetical protein